MAEVQRSSSSRADPRTVYYQPGIIAYPGFNAVYKAARDSGSVRGVCVGDSISQGQFANASGSAPAGYDYRSKGYWEQFCQNTMSLYGLADGGEFFSPYGESKFVVPNFVTAEYDSPAGLGVRPIVIPGTSGEIAGGAYATRSTTDTQNGWWRQIVFSYTTAMTTPGTALYIHNPPTGAKRVSVLWEAHGITPTKTFKVNGLGTPGTGDVTVSITASDGLPHETVIYTDPSVPIGVPVYVGSQSATSVCRVLGFMSHKNYGTGFERGRMAYGGNTLGLCTSIASGLTPSDKVASMFYSSKSDYSSDGYSGWPRSPHLVVLALGLNDSTVNANFSLSPDEWERHMTRMIGWIRRSQSNATVIILMPWHSDDFEDISLSLTGTSAWKLYQRAAERLARTWNVAVIDFGPLWSPLASSNGYITLDQHPTVTGYKYMADTLTAVVNA